VNCLVILKTVEVLHAAASGSVIWPYDQSARGCRGRLRALFECRRILCSGSEQEKKEQTLANLSGTGPGQPPGRVVGCHSLGFWEVYLIGGTPQSSYKPVVRQIDYAKHP